MMMALRWFLIRRLLDQSFLFASFMYNDVCLEKRLFKGLIKIDSSFSFAFRMIFCNMLFST